MSPGITRESRDRRRKIIIEFIRRPYALTAIDLVYYLDLPDHYRSGVYVNHLRPLVDAGFIESHPSPPEHGKFKTNKAREGYKIKQGRDALVTLVRELDGTEDQDRLYQSELLQSELLRDSVPHIAERFYDFYPLTESHNLPVFLAKWDKLVAGSDVEADGFSTGTLTRQHVICGLKKTTADSVPIVYLTSTTNHTPLTHDGVDAIAAEIAHSHQLSSENTAYLVARLHIHLQNMKPGDTVVISNYSPMPIDIENLSDALLWSWAAVKFVTWFSLADVEQRRRDLAHIRFDARFLSDAAWLDGWKACMACLNCAADIDIDRMAVAQERLNAASRSTPDINWVRVFDQIEGPTSSHEFTSHPLPDRI